MSDLIERARPFLQQCGSCDAGLPMSCTCPTGDYRPVMADLVAEVERLRQRTQPGGDDMSDKVSARDLHADFEKFSDRGVLCRGRVASAHRG
jgi:hypothetical protein